MKFIFLHLSESAATWIYWMGGIMVLLGSFMALWGDRERERYSDIRTSDNEKITKQAVKDTSLANQAAADANRLAGEANERAAALKERALKSELELERLRREVAPRYIPRDKFLNAVTNQPKARVEIMYLRDDPECFDVAQQVWQLLQEAKWDVIPPAPIPVPTNVLDLGGPVPMSVDGQPSGITVVANSASEVIEASTMEERQTSERTPFTALKHAFLESLGKIASWTGGPHQPPIGTLRVIVAPRTGPSQGP